MRLFLIRHGETVDNVAQVYAGSKDSELTNHGYQQATRLGEYLHASGLRFTHLFSSHLQRAFKTAQLIRDAQKADLENSDNDSMIRDVNRLPMLMEQDFGFYEGKKWYERPSGSSQSGRDSHREGHKDNPGFVDVESRESMAQRADAFLNEHLLPLFDGPAAQDHTIAIVSHGIILSTLWKRLLLRLPPQSVKFSAEMLSTTRIYSLEHLGGWSNTGYLDLLLEKDDSPPLQRPVKLGIRSSNVAPEPLKGLDQSDATTQSPLVTGVHSTTTSDGATDVADDTAPLATGSKSPTITLVYGWRTTILVINGRDHLKNLKRTRGGVGSARHDENQKSIESFFKRKKVS